MYDVRGTHVAPGMTEEQKRKARKWELPTTIAALLVIPYLILENKYGGEGTDNNWADVLHIVNYALWIFFIAEAIAMLRLAPDDLWWVKHNVVDIGVIVAATPFLFEDYRWVQTFLLVRVLDLLPVIHHRLFRITTFRFAVVLVFLVALGGGIAFADVEMIDTDEGGPAQYTLQQGIYWAITTLSTVGYGDYTADTELGQWISNGIQLAGLVIGAIFVAAIIPLFDKEFAEGFSDRVKDSVAKVAGDDGEKRVTREGVATSATGTAAMLDDAEHPADEPEERPRLDMSGYTLLDQMAKDQAAIIERLDRLAERPDKPDGDGTA